MNVINQLMLKVCFWDGVNRERKGCSSSEDFSSELHCPLFYLYLMPNVNVTR